MSSDLVWDFTLNFCNQVLRWGLEREAEQLDIERKAARLRRMQIEWRTKRNAAYREVNQEEEQPIPKTYADVVLPPSMLPVDVSTPDVDEKVKNPICKSVEKNKLLKCTQKHPVITERRH